MPQSIHGLDLALRRSLNFKVLAAVALPSNAFTVPRFVKAISFSVSSPFFHLFADSVASFRICSSDLFISK